MHANSHQSIQFQPLLAPILPLFTIELSIITMQFLPPIGSNCCHRLVGEANSNVEKLVHHSPQTILFLLSDTITPNSVEISCFKIYGGLG